MMEHTVLEIARGSTCSKGLHEVRQSHECNAEACDNLASKKCNALPRSLSTLGGRVRACGILALLLAVLFLEAFASRRTRVRGVTLPGVGASAAGTATDCSHRAEQAMWTQYPYLGQCTWREAQKRVRAAICGRTGPCIEADVAPTCAQEEGDEQKITM